MRRTVRAWLRPAAAAAALAAVVWRLGAGPFLDGVRAVDGRALAAAAAIGLLTTLCCAWRWTVVARGLGVELVLSDAVARSVGQKAATLKSEKRSGLRVHGRTGLPCPVCGDTVREVSFADRSFQYCPTCQTEGRELADRRLSRLIK